MWEKRKKAIDHEYVRMVERRKSTKKLMDLRESGKTCSGCAFFDNKSSPNNEGFFGYCTCSKKLKEKEYDGYKAAKKLIHMTRKSCKYYEEKIKK